MSDRTAAELEQDAELARARVADTAESIRAKMSPGQIIDEMTGLFSGSDGTSALSTLKAQVSQNPLALSLVGAGMAWLMLGNNGVSSNGKSEYSNLNNGMSRPRHYSDHLDSPPFDYAASDDTGPSIGERVSQAGETMSSIADTALGAVKEVVSSVGKRASETVGETASNATDRARKVTGSAQDFLTQEPLVLAALGLAVGTAIGAMLPHSRLEDEQLGSLSEKVRTKAKDVIDKGLDEAKDVAAGVYGSVKEAADEEFKAGDDGRTVADKMASVVKSAASETEASIRDRVSTME